MVQRAPVRWLGWHVDGADSWWRGKREILPLGTYLEMARREGGALFVAGAAGQEEALHEARRVQPDGPQGAPTLQRAGEGSALLARSA